MIGNTNAVLKTEIINRGYSVESIDNGDGTQTLQITSEDDAIMAANIEMYRFQDLSRVIMSGGIIATNEEYTNAEEYLQGVYSLILNGGSNE